MLTLHNTLTGKKEPFVPLDDQSITLYVCGPTVYNYVHIGNGRPAVVFDVLVRLLRMMYPKVTFARNITDIDDKINASALENGEPIKALAERFTEAYDADIEALHVLPPDVVPHATDHIEEIIDMINSLISKGHAYAADGHVLFNVPSDPEYGSLSRRSLDDMLDGARVEVAPYKKDAKEFVLWKPSSDELPGWESPWGRGRPGWHIECSAMIRKHLGLTIDIHGGGSDLTFPHHENESAQSRCGNGAPFVRYWMHNGMLTMGSEKMSKSLGNVVTLKELREIYPGEVLRYALLSAQYRSSLAWSTDLLDQASRSLDTLYQALRELPALHNQTSADYAGTTLEDLPAAVLDPLLDDLNSPGALAAMHGLASAIHKTRNEQEKQLLGEQLLRAGWVLGILNENVESHFTGGSDVDPAEIEALIAKRRQARLDKNFARADEIRDQLLDRGIELEDTREGTRWKLITS
jgi:cysteinyl-tRNA synthetase